MSARLRPRGQGGAWLVLGLGAATVWLTLAAVVGAITLGGDESELVAGEGAPAVDDTIGPVGDDAAPTTGDADASTTTVQAGDSGSDNAAQTATTAATTGGATAASQGGTAGPSNTDGGGDDGAAPVPGDRTGVTDSEIHVGVHAPLTIGGVPLNLAEDPVKGLEAYTEYLNEHDGGIHGRKLVIQLEDDRFEPSGAQVAAQRMIHDSDNFMVSGTLGIDQVAVVAAEAAKAGVPYTAAGGSEENPIPGMYQLSATYTTHVEQLAAFIASDPELKGKRVGILVSDSQYIKPVAETFQRELEARGQTVSTTVTNQKPQENPDYNGYILQFRRTNTEIVVPLTDPLTTQQIVQRCAAGAACGWTYSFTNFAHDSDTALALMAPTWGAKGVKGLSSVCYYLAPEVDGNNCASMHIARDQYIAINSRDAWEDEGSGAAFGYQIVSYLKGAMRAAGADLTRERFVAALRDFSGYSDLVSGPINYGTSAGTMHGAEAMAVYQAQSNNKYKMISPGLVTGF